MNIKVTSEGPSSPKVFRTLSGGFLINPPEEERLTVRVRGLDPRSGIGAVQIGEAVDNGDLYLFLEMKSGETETLRFNLHGHNECGPQRPGPEITGNQDDQP